MITLAQLPMLVCHLRQIADEGVRSHGDAWAHGVRFAADHLEGGEVYTVPPAPSDPVGPDRMAIKLLVAAGFVTEEKANESLRIAHGFGGDLGLPAPAAVPVDTFQDGVSRWMGECFLPSLYSNMTERGDRLLEEVLELLQSNGYDPARVQTLVQYVYGRPVGDPAQEVGGVMVTLAGYCWIADLNMHDEGARELARITQPEVMAKIRRKQEAKNALHFDTPLPGHATHPQPAAANADINATRYLYLRSQPVEGGPWGTPRIAIPSSERAGQFANGEDADAAIDAAIAALNASLDKPAAAKDGDA
ncbi:hypothetical protein [Xanthomonas arboricola]|uniref:hypothetical protein n=1 Tax=Xanthomonas arboricola TaxID=56448 RepID=UPI0016225ED3|nr:hypothetical protein [Xanthomonas arboricola]MBB3759260.1 hypothetical protein [Xanthomonas arboricola]